MREIKFRVWDSRFKKMITDASDIRMNIATAEVHGRRSDGNVDYWHPMQYTGLKDCEGREIWEGDIIEKSSSKFCQAGKVEMFHGCWMVVEKEDRYFNLHFHKHECKVIGNIHENKELIGE